MIRQEKGKEEEMKDTNQWMKRSHVQKIEREQGMALAEEECLSCWCHVTGLVGLEGEVVLANHKEDMTHFPIQLN